MSTHRIAVIAGDGIGPEVIEQAIRVAEAAARAQRSVLEWNRLPWSSAYYKKHGRILPEDGWQVLAKHDAILFGAIGSPDVPDKVTVHDLLLPMRRKFDEYVNLRPAYLFPGVAGPLRDKAPGSIDMLKSTVPRTPKGYVRARSAGRLYEGTANEVAVRGGYTFTSTTVASASSGRPSRRHACGRERS